MFSPSFNIFYLMRLVGRNYFKNYGAIFTDFFLPLIIITILFNLLPTENMNTIGFMLPGALLMPIASSCFISFSIGFSEWKQSILAKKIHISKISLWEFFAVFIIFFTLVSFFSFGFVLCYVILLEQVGLESLKGTTNHLSKIKWELAILAIFLLILITNGLGFLFTSLTNKTQVVLALTLTLFIVQAFMLGNYLPLNMVVHKKAMKFASFFLPFYAPTRMFQVVWLSDLSINESTSELFIQDWKVVTNFIIIATKPIIRTTVHFHKSYWSLVLLSFGWILTTILLSLYFNKKQKFA